MQSIHFLENYSMTIDGQAVTSSEDFSVINPAHETVIAKVPDASKEQLDQAVDSATKAFHLWRKTPIELRQAALAKMADRLEQYQDSFMRLLTSEQGKPHADAKAEIARCITWLRTYSERTIPLDDYTDAGDRKVEIKRVPIGVVAAIAPWNFPMTLAIWKIAPALLAGNTVILKPSPFTPLTSLKMGELFRDLLPKGVLNVISGSDRLGPWMTEHPRIQKVAFTGSTATGKRIMQSAATNLKRITLELGGNDPAIVLPDVDIQKVAPLLFWGAFRNSAQYCLAIKRLYIHDSIYESLSQAIVNYAKTVVMGDGAVAGTQLGPIQNKMQFEKVKAFIHNARQAGLSFLLGGEVPSAKGYFVPVTIVDNPPEDSPVVTEEPFGPIIPLLKFTSIDDVIARANHTEYGLGASIWSADEQLAKTIAEQLDCGTVWINHIQVMSPNVPFGGHKQSGIGVENALDGLLEFTNIQTIAFAPKQ